MDTIKPEYQNAVECAEEVMTHDACPDTEKAQVKEDVELLHTTWNSVLDVMDEETKRLYSPEITLVYLLYDDCDYNFGDQ